MTGDVVRRLVAGTMAQQLSDAVESATAPFQYALSTRAPHCTCIARIERIGPKHHNRLHRWHRRSRSDLSGSHVGWFDERGRGQPSTSFRQNVLRWPPSSYLWEDSSGVTHMIPQGEGGEQGDPLMPFLFSLGQHSALEVVQEDLHDSEFLFAMTRTLQPLHTESEMCTSQWMRICGFIPASASTAARRRCGMQSTTDQSFATRWRSLPAGHTPRPVWRGSDLFFEKQGIKILGTPFGHPQLVEAHLNKKIVEHEVLLERIPTVPDLQSAWSLLLHCAAARANCFLRVVLPAATRGFVHRHNGGLWK